MSVVNMKTKYKFIYFEKIAITEDLQKPSWLCRNNKTNDILGTIFWYQTWKQYVFEPESQFVVFSKSCFRDIIDFMEQL